MGIQNMKIPDFKFPKLKMKGIENIEEMKINYDSNKIKGKNKNYEISKYKTIKEVFERSMKEYKDEVFMLEKFNHKEPFKEISFGEFGKDVISLGTALTNYLNVKNERVIIIGENTYHWYVSYMAMLCGAGMAVPIDKELPVNEIENVINRSKASVVIYSTKKKDAIKKVKDNLPGVKYFVQMNSDEPLNGRDIGINVLIKEGNKLVEAGDDSFSKIEIDPDEFKVLIFTSGTTSEAKGVMICNRNLAENINAVSAYVKLDTKDRFFSILPLHHTYESTIGFLVPFASGASIAICEGLKYIVPNLQEAKPTVMLAVPLLIENLHKKINASIKKSGKAGIVNSMIHLTNALKTVGVDIKRKVFAEILENLGGNIRIIVSAAAPIDPKIAKWVSDIGIMLLQGYGLTETSPIAALTPEFDTHIGSVGKPVICAEVKIDNPNEKGEGEILIKSKTLMLGYYENEEATKEALEPDGWFHTGDLARIDKDGFIYIAGRKKSVIVLNNGKNVFPEEIETLLNKVEGIKESFVYEKKEDDGDVKVCVKIVYDKEMIKELYNIEGEDKIREFLWEKVKDVNKLMPKYKYVREMIITEEELIKTTTLKIKRHEEMKKIFG